MIVSQGKTVATTDTLVDSPKNSRSYVGVQNLDGANAVHITFGGAAATSLNGVRIGPGEFYESTAPFNGAEIRGISITGSVNIIFITD